MEFDKIPTGLGQKLEARKETLPALEVKNKVVWVNPDLELPFNLEVNKPTPLGLFLGNIKGTDVKKKNLGVNAKHGRSAVLGRVIFKEKHSPQGVPRLYRDVDVKGAGSVIDGFEIGPVVPKKGEESYGILSMDAAYKDMGIAETFHEHGMRTHRAVAIIELEEIISGRERISVQQARDLKLISKNMVPVVEVRAYGVQGRLMDVVESSDERKTLLIDDARTFVAQELGIEPEKFTTYDYAMWLAQTIGKNLGFMRKHRYIHQYLSMGHNITLDGALVDFDSVLAFDPTKGFDFKADYTDAGTAFATFLYSGIGLSVKQSEEVMKEYTDSYQKSIAK